MSPAITGGRGDSDDSSEEGDSDGSGIYYYDNEVHYEHYDAEDILPKCFKDGIIGGDGGGFGGGGSNRCGDYNSGGGGYTGGNGSSFWNESGGGGGSYSVDPKATRKLGWFEEGKVIIKFIRK